MQDKAIIVTGASSGAGNTLAITLVMEGYEALAVARRKERLENLAVEHNNIIPVCANITIEQDHNLLVAKVAELNKPIDIVNNEAIASPKSIDLLTEDEWRKTFSIDIEHSLELQ